MKTKFNIKTLLFLHAVILIYAIGTVFSKMAATLEPFFLFYALFIMCLGIYALAWQQILKKMPLNFAFANKSVTLVWGMIFGVVIFKETLSWLNIVGAAIVLVGIVFMVTGDSVSVAEDQKSLDNQMPSQKGNNTVSYTEGEHD